jgi:hypothetical protein
MVATGMLAFSAVKNVGWSYLTHKPTRILFPGRYLADEVARRWHTRCKAPLPIAAGEGWLAGNICVHSSQQPIIYSSGAMGYFVFEPVDSPWTSDVDFATRGGVLLWDADQLGAALPGVVRARFPAAETQPPILLTYQTGADVRPFRAGVAFVWPATAASAIARQ